MRIAPSVCGRSIRFRLVELDDAPLLFRLRTDESRNAHLSAVKEDESAQAAWLIKYKEREAEDLEFYFVIETVERDSLGLVRLYDFRGPSFCWGSWIIRPGAPKSTAIESALLVYETAFGPLGFTAAHFDVRKDNERVWTFHERMGAKLAKVTERDRFYTYTRDDYLATRTKYQRFLPVDDTGHAAPLLDLGVEIRE
jgi:RimJ/RimL family protein N-acetyltransferase